MPNVNVCPNCGEVVPANTPLTLCPSCLFLRGTVSEPDTGDFIDGFRLIERIGVGGMGAVYRAEQLEPVRREVAFKLIKPGMDSEEVIARFEAERQALALMDHPNIARVLEGGATPSGRPYFVMELVTGVPITEFCEQHRLSIKERLELFQQLCRAVQHAHQKGIIHRDLKPSNILVAEQDGQPALKVIDFGVAKALQQRLTDRTLFTVTGQMIGTPLYMSPEQVGGDPDIDTRADIYSLGVLLYELLTGVTPFDEERIRQAAFDQVIRIFREEEPLRPSLRASTLGEKLHAVARARNVDPKIFWRQLWGDLDWIAMKAIEKERARRYETAEALAADVGRYLANEPILARPPSTAYRLKKFARRNRVALTTAVVVAQNPRPHQSHQHSRLGA